jgi:hypothetical protein
LYLYFAIITREEGIHTVDFWLCFTCPARFSELLPGDLGSSAIFVQNLISQALNGSHLIGVVVAVELDFFVSESTYFVRIHIRYEAHLTAIPYDLEVLKLEIESVVSQAMLQCFWEIHYSEC